MRLGLSREAVLTSFPWSPRGDHLILSVRLTPKSSRDEIAGIGQLSDDRTILQVRVRALPRDGAANAALLKIIAKTLCLPATSVHLESGATGRVKTLRLVGDTAALQAELARLTGLA